MNSSLFIVVQVLGWVLIHSLWKGALLGCATRLALALLRHARPHSRYAVLCGALCFCIAMPALDVYRYFNEAATALASQTLYQAQPMSTEMAAELTPVHQLLPWLVIFWMLGVIAVSTRLALGLLWVHSFGNASRGWADAHWQACVSSLAVRCGIHCQVALRVVPDLGSPMTIGWWRPMVLVPAALLTHMPPDLLEALLAHEIAHIRRLDYLVNLLQCTIEALLFYHPVVWWLSKRIRIEREQIADDFAAAAIGKPRRLALALESLSQFQCAAPQLAQLAQGGNLLDRIKRLLHPSSQTPGWSAVASIIAIGIAVTSLIIHVHGQTPAPSMVIRRVAQAKPQVGMQAAVDQNMQSPAKLFCSNHGFILNQSCIGTR